MSITVVKSIYIHAVRIEYSLMHKYLLNMFPLMHKYLLNIHFLEWKSYTGNMAIERLRCKVCLQVLFAIVSLQYVLGR